GSCTTDCATTNNGDGTYTATLTSATLANNSVSVTAKLDSSALTNTASLAFVAGPATKLVITGQTTSALAGDASSGTSSNFVIAVTAKDANNNTATVSQTTGVALAISTGTNGTLANNTGSITTSSKT